MLKISHISKTFNPGTVNEKKAIEDLSLELKQGDFATIIGSNGAGKSTLFNAICGDFLTDTGSIELDNKDITFMPQHARARSIGRLYQDPMRGTAPGMTIEENLALAAGKGGWLSHTTRQEKERFREELKKLDIGLEERMSHPVGLLSGGQRQALTLLMATMNPPKLLLLDEHTAALDPGTAEKVLNLTRRIVEEHQLTCLMITHNISKTFNPGTVNEKKAIEDLSLELKQGDFATIIGSNGAGKSTLFNAICGDFLTDTGSIELDNKDITFMPQHARARSIGRLYQDPMRGTAPGMTIEENLALAAGKGGWLSHTTRQEKERFREELKKLDIGLEERMSHPVGLLSGGQRQALTLLMATMNPPKLLLLDEHTAALDPGTAEKVLNLTRRIVEEHQLTCLMITHNMQSAIELGNRILMMDSGNIVLDIGGEEKKNMTVEGLLEKFRSGAGKALDNDRILLSD